jgi:hypothetical protein
MQKLQNAKNNNLQKNNKRQKLQNAKTAKCKKQQNAKN